MSDSNRNEIPPFPVDDSTLDLVERALTIDEESGDTQTSLFDLLDLLSQMGGSDPDAYEEVDAGDLGLDDFPDVEIRIMRDAFYNEHDLILALIQEVRRLRNKETSS